jgi:hypothetical protein
MIHEHEAAEYASAAMDFTLADHEERWLQHELAECPVCTERAAAYHEQLRLLQRLPTLEASDRTRIRITQAATAGRVDTRSPMMLVFAAALLVGMLLALTAAAGAFLDKSDDLSSVPTAPPSPLASGPLVAASAEPSVPPVGEAGNGGFSDELAGDSIVEVVSDNLRVRSEPRVASDSVLYEPLLRLGDRLFVIDGPVEASDYDWYRVILIGDGTNDQSWAELRSGWVARGDHDGTPWIETDPPNCPEEPVEVADLRALHPLERLACFGSRPLSFDAVIEGGSQDGWIAETRTSQYLELPGNGLELSVEPGGGLTAADLPNRRAVSLEGSFGNCGSFEDDVVSLLGCRTTFKVSRAVAHPADFPFGAVGRIVTNDLQLRSRPVVAEDSALPSVLNEGARVGIVDGPAVGSGYVWYQVAVPSIRATDGGPLIGWIASTGQDGEPWLDHDSIACAPPGQVTFEQFANLALPPVYHGGQVCYGRTATSPPPTLELDAHARVVCSDPAASSAGSWLKAGEPLLVLEHEGQVATAVLAPGATAPSCSGTMSSTVYHLAGHFDDDASGECSGPDAPVADRAAAVYECRNRFVVTELNEIDAGPTPQPTP